ncbi:hypothetical protein JW948_10055 [bacterium]|nr:hypothetical protein [bacterium]
MTHDELKEQYRQGRITIDVSRAMARKFYTRIPMSLIAQETGESVIFHKMIIWLFYLSGPVLLVYSLFLGFRAFGAWGFITLFCCPLIYFLFSVASLKSNTNPVWISMLLVIAAFAAFFGRTHSPVLIRFSLAYLFSLWSLRFVYWESARLLRIFVLRNEKAYAYLAKYLTIHQRGQQA